MKHIFDVELAAHLGCSNEAIILQHIAFLQGHTGQFLNREKWVKRSVAMIQSTYPYMTTKSLRGAIDRLISSDYMEEKKSFDGDRSKSYRLTEKGWDLIILYCEGAENDAQKKGQMSDLPFAKRANGFAKRANDIKDNIKDNKISHSKEKSAGACENDFYDDLYFQALASEVENENLNQVAAAQKIEVAPQNFAPDFCENDDDQDNVPEIPNEWILLAEKSPKVKIMYYNGTNERTHKIQTAHEIVEATHEILTRNPICCDFIRGSIGKGADFDLTSGFTKFLESTLSNLHENSGGYVTMRDFIAHLKRFAPAYFRAKQIEKAKDASVNLYVSSVNQKYQQQNQHDESRKFAGYSY